MQRLREPAVPPDPLPSHGITLVGVFTNLEIACFISDIIFGVIYFRF